MIFCKLLVDTKRPCVCALDTAAVVLEHGICDNIYSRARLSFGARLEGPFMSISVIGVNIYCCKRL